MTCPCCSLVAVWCNMMCGTTHSTASCTNERNLRDKNNIIYEFVYENEETKNCVRTKINLLDVRILHGDTHNQFELLPINCLRIFLDRIT